MPQFEEIFSSFVRRIAAFYPICSWLISRFMARLWPYLLALVWFLPSRLLFKRAHIKNRKKITGIFGDANCWKIPCYWWDLKKQPPRVGTGFTRTLLRTTFWPPVWLFYQLPWFLRRSSGNATIFVMRLFGFVQKEVAGGYQSMKYGYRGNGELWRYVSQR